ncbi:tubulin polymerization-promoting protein family member 3-like [Branchiostoma floridae]|uniref:Tubulin polymerization-promoting protein family member 3-like n=1 Tax=Branchiostoma floridae TaxID=7739 RepID=C3ZAW1_BRAFL|nr:tubulin polymerization-promoting protein family member 3-like [Branchiostoma floridae]|eukprot:XP_002593987.1 hypothetical protein BRAFLDRAFT_68575 [Branchiostoma floridae]
MADAVDTDDFADAFRAYATQDNTEGTGKEMTRENFVKMCKDCKVIDGKKVTETDVDIVFSKVKDKSASTITVEKCKTALEELVTKGFPKDFDCEESNRVDPLTDPENLMKLILSRRRYREEDLSAYGPKSQAGLTDLSTYTGSAKGRFGVEPGKGRGIEGREHVEPGGGYGLGYNDAGTDDASGKGRGIEGHKDVTKNTDYVAPPAGTYDKKVKE